MTESPKRKLAAIMFTDMVGYTALMQKDESKARELIQRHRELMKPHVEKHGGEILQFHYNFSLSVNSTNFQNP